MYCFKMRLQRCLFWLLNVKSRLSSVLVTGDTCQITQMSTLFHRQGFQRYMTEDFHCAGLGHRCAAGSGGGQRLRSASLHSTPPGVTHLLSYSGRLVPRTLAQGHSVCRVTLRTQRAQWSVLNVVTSCQTHPVRSAWFWTLCTAHFLCTFLFIAGSRLNILHCIL